MTYDELTTTQKADFIAYCLNCGLVDYFDQCKKEKDGTYTYTMHELEEVTNYTAEELVREFEREDGIERLRLEYGNK